MSNPPERPTHPTPEQLAESKRFGEFLIRFMFDDPATVASVAATRRSDPRPPHRPEYLTVVRPKD